MTPIETLLSCFDSEDRSLHIKISKIEHKIISLSTNHTVTYCPHEAIAWNNSPIIGMLEQVEVKRGWDEVGIENYIHYVNSLDHDYKRLVVAKELIHVLDPNCYLTVTPTDVKILMDDLAAPALIKGLGSHSNHDSNTAVVLAAGLFLPLSLRAKMIADFKEGRLTAAAIAKNIEIPIPYVIAVMQDWWPDLLSHCLETFGGDDEQ